MTLVPKLFFCIFLLFLMIFLPVRGEAGTDEILLGMSAPLSGPTAKIGTAVRDGILAGIARINREGGVNGRPLRLIVLDDGYEPTRTAPNMRRLIEEEGVLAVIGNVGTPTAITSLPLAKKSGTLLFAPFSGAGVLRQEPPERYVINFRASYAEEIGAMVDALIAEGGLRPRDIAFFTQRDGYGDAGYSAGLAALTRHGLEDERRVVHVRYPRNTLAVENALADLLLAEPAPRAVIMVGAYAPCAKFIDLARRSGLDALFLSVSFVGGDFLAEKLAPDVEGVIVTQVVPHPDLDLPIVRDYVADSRHYDTKLAPNFVGLEGYIAVRLLGRALATIEGVPTREGVIDALEELDTFDLGLGRALHLGRNDHQASHEIWATRLQGGRLVPFTWPQIPSLLTQSEP
jgi:ABC-type branched-subunit amino acid transport system substrate-binding protein